MIIVRSIRDLPAYGIDHVSVACGIFDGVHLGHQAIIARLLQHAAASGSVPVVLTFDPHPQSVLNPAGAPDLLLSPMHRLKVLARHGIKAAVVLPFSAAFASFSPQEFVNRELVVDGMRVDHICVGAAWRFGHKAQGDVNFLRQIGPHLGFEVDGIELTADDDEIVSSSRIRGLLVDGKLDKVEALLGRPFSILGPVALGKGIATSTLRYPTANVTPGNGCFPPIGIYVATAWLEEGNESTRRRLPGVLYLGYSPTFMEDAPARPFVEMHIFDFHEDIYGRQLQVDFLHFIRGDQKFPSAAALAEQIGHDVEAARQWHLDRELRAGL